MSESVNLIAASIYPHPEFSFEAVVTLTRMLLHSPPIDPATHSRVAIQRKTVSPLWQIDAAGGYFFLQY